jgi:hypothetical protein
MRHKLVLWFVLLIAGFLVGFILQYARLQRLQLDQGFNSARSSHLGSAGHSSCGARLLTVLPRKTTVVIEVNSTLLFQVP